MHKYRNLVFKGGGVKGIAYAGALEALQHHTSFASLEHVAGTSAGAITATLLAVGYTPEEITQIVSKEMDFAAFMDKSWLVGNMMRFLHHFGWYKGDAFMQWIEDKIKAKTGSAKLNFLELQELHAQKPHAYKLLHVVATDLSKQAPVLFSHKENDYTPIALAVRMSMSIPLFFKSIRWNNSVMVDGGMAYNYPIDLFDKAPYHAHTNKGHGINKETLGLWIDTKAGIDNLRRHLPKPPVKIKGIKSYSASLIAYLMEMANQAHLEPQDWNRSILIDSLDVQATDFEHVKNKIPELIESGKKGVKYYFEWLNTQTQSIADLPKI